MPRFPDSVPMTMQEFEKLQWVDPALCCDLNWEGFSPGQYIAPDGGTVKYWKKDNWQWERKDGWIVWSGGSLISLVRKDDMRINAWRLRSSGEYNQRSVIEFRDGSIAVRWKNEYFDTFMYRYENGRRVGRFIARGEFLPQSRVAGNYVFHFDERDSHFVDIVSKSPRVRELHSLLASEFQAKNESPVPFLLFHSLDDYAGFLQEKNRPRPGGRGFIDSILLCCEELYGPEPKSKEELRKRIEAERLDVILHEMTHSLMAQACFHKPGVDFENRIYMGLAFSEGMAEWATSTINPEYRTALFRRNFNRMDAGKLPPTFDAMNQRSARAKYGYSPMFWVWFYVEETMGRHVLNQYITALCGGDARLRDSESRKEMSYTERVEWERKMAAEIAEDSFGMTLEELYTSAIAFFRSNRSAYERLYDKWDRGTNEYLRSH